MRHASRWMAGGSRPSAEAAGLPSAGNDTGRGRGTGAAPKGQARAWQPLPKTQSWAWARTRCPEREVMPWLHMLSYKARNRKGRRRIPLKVVAEMAGLNRDTPFPGLMSSKVFEMMCAKLSWVIRATEERRLRS
jgi:hypothetical protein